MHSSDPRDIDASRPPLGDRIPPRPPPSVPERTPTQCDAHDQALGRLGVADRAYVESLAERFSPLMEAAIRQIDNHRHDLADDAKQDVLTNISERLAGRKGPQPEHPEAYLPKAARNRVITLRRKQSNRNRIDEQMARSVKQTAGPSDLEVIARDIVESLSPKYREIADMLAEGRRKPEIAQALGISLSGVYRRVGEIQKELAPLLLEND